MDSTKRLNAIGNAKKINHKNNSKRLAPFFNKKEVGAKTGISSFYASIGDSFEDLEGLFRLKDSSDRMMAGWDLLFPLYATGKIELPNKENYTPIIVSCVNSFREIIVNTTSAYLPDEALRYLKYHPNRISKLESFELNQSDPFTRTMLLGVKSEMLKEGVPDSEFSRYLHKYLLKLISHYTMLLPNLMYDEGLDLVPVTFCPGTLLFVSKLSVEEVNSFLLERGINEAYEVLEVDGSGSTDWFLRNFG